ncbi:MAG: hypothetical protein QF685_12575 [Verrucomicrobiota bacterium]|jgi:hypothetical protein|nr:hypothetical protein [Verrucomicrobiota bacterium]
MKKIIPTIFAIVLVVSSVSLSVGCGPTVDPDAAAKDAENKKAPEDIPKEGAGVDGVSENPADGGFKDKE